LTHQQHRKESRCKSKPFHGIPFPGFFTNRYITNYITIGKKPGDAGGGTSVLSWKSLPTFLP
jgi:hypothetical protein